MQKLTVDVWSDVVCPWCAIGKRRLERALASFAHKDEVRVVFHAFELDPSAPRVREGDNAARLAAKYGKTKAEAEKMIGHVSEIAAADGLDFHLLTARTGNTFDAHRLLRLARDNGLQPALKERLMRAYMTEEQAIGDRAVLARLAVEVGLDEAEVAALLEGDRYAAEVREDEATARSLGISGVPFFVFGGKYAVSGAQTADVLRGALEQAWDGLRTGEVAEGASCGPEGCA